MAIKLLLKCANSNSMGGQFDAENANGLGDLVGGSGPAFTHGVSVHFTNN